MSLDFLSPMIPGNAVRTLAVDHGLFPEEYPRGDERSLATVLNDLELLLMVAPERWHALESDLTRLADDFPARERETTRQWVASMWPLLTPSTLEATSMVDGDSDFSIGGFGSSPQMEDLRRARSRAMASLDDLSKNEKKQVLWQWLDDVCASGLSAHEQARLIGELAPQVSGLEPIEVMESAWERCLDGLAAIANRQPHDQVLSERLLQVVGTLPVLQKVRYPNNPMVFLAGCREQMRLAGYPEVVSALYQTAARQMAASMDQNAEKSHIAFGNLLRQIGLGINAGDGIPLRQMKAVLDPAIARWTERHGHAVQTAWEAFLGTDR